MRLKDKIAIVTGGAQGVGAGIVSQLAAAGAIVVIADIDRDKAGERVEQMTEAGQKAAFVYTDVADPVSVDQLFEQVVAQFGQVDILVNNAALVHYPPANVNVLEMADDTWLKNMDVSLNGTFFCSTRAARIMVKQVVDGNGTGGSIINISSGGGTRGHRHLASYDASKGGVEAFTRSAALDLAPWNVRVNAIVPGNIAVERMMGSFSADAAKGTVPLGRPGTPSEIGDAAVFLASDEARYVTGTKIYVDGGMDIQLRSPGVDREIGSDITDRLFGSD